ncbi:magnesium transporter CorA family protein [Candidatus Saccharibacteria bacterium]|nr:magnesium transporter CorA family protein [Candidatus Saccharibacteria bacterium]
MIKIYRTNNEKLDVLETITANCWIDLVNPTEAEIDQVIEKTKIDRDLIDKMLDENELPRIETSGDSTLVVIDAPVRDEEDEDEYATFPLGIILSDRNYIVTVSTKKVTVLHDFRHSHVKNFRTAKKSRFLIQILGKTSAQYLKILNKVYKEIEKKEDKLERSTKNEDLIDLLATEKTLVYFTTSLKENDLVLERLISGNTIRLYEGDSDMLEDAMIENRQAIDMAKIYQDILSSITGTYATVVSNNLNDVMKFLAGITVVLSVPTIISSFMGMNVPFGDFDDGPMSWLVLLIVSALASVVVFILMKKKGLL